MKLILPLLLLICSALPVLAQSPEILWMRNRDSAQIRSVQFSSDSRTLASSNSIGQIRIWETESGRLLRTLTGANPDARSIAFSSSGNILAVAGSAASIEIWDLDRFVVVRTIPNDASINSVAISPNGNLVAAGDDGGQVKVWEVASGSLVWTLNRHTDTVNSVAFSADSRTIVSGSDDDTFILWDLASGAPIDQKAPNDANVTAVALSPDGHTVAAAVGNYMIVEYRLDSLDQPFKVTPNNHPVAITSIAYSPDSRLLASTSRDYSLDGFIIRPTLIVTDRADAGRKFEYLRRHEDAEGFATAVGFSPDGRHLAWGSFTGQVHLLERAPASDAKIFLPRMRTITNHNTGVRATALSSRGGLLATGDPNGAINLWEAGSGLLLGRLTGHTYGVNALDFSADGRSLASAAADGTIRIWDVAGRRLQRTIVVSAEWSVSSVAFSPDGERIAGSIGFGDSIVAVWDTSKPDPIRTFVHGDAVNAVAYAEGDRVISAGENGAIKIWNVSTGALDFLLDQSVFPWLALSLSGDGRILAAANADRSIHFWAIPSGDPLGEITGLDAPATSIDLSGNGSILVSAGREPMVRVWETGSRREIHRYTADPALQLSAAINADSGWVASGTTEGSVIVWKFSETTGVRAADAAAITSAMAIPNPTDGRVSIVVESAAPAELEAVIYSIDGQRVATIRSRRDGSGMQRFEWDASRVAAGMYFYRIATANGVAGGSIVVERDR